MYIFNHYVYSYTYMLTYKHVYTICYTYSQHCFLSYRRVFQTLSQTRKGRKKAQNPSRFNSCYSPFSIHQKYDVSYFYEWVLLSFLSCEHAHTHHIHNRETHIYTYTHTRMNAPTPTPTHMSKGCIWLRYSNLLTHPLTHPPPTSLPHAHTSTSASSGVQTHLSLRHPAITGGLANEN